MIGILTDDGSDATAVLSARDAIAASGMVPLIMAPVGDTLGSTEEPVRRICLTAR